MSLPGIHSVVGGDVAQYMKVSHLPQPGRYTMGGSEGSSVRKSKRPLPPAGLPPPGSGKGYGIGSDRGKKRPISPEVGPGGGLPMVEVGMEASTEARVGASMEAKVVA